MGKKKIKLMLLGAMDKLEQVNATQVEKNKYKDKRRIQICNSTKLSKEQIAEVDNLYVDNYGKKIPLCWHESYTAYTGKFDKNYFPELLYIPKFERYMNFNSSLANVLEDKNLLYVFAKNANVKMPKRYLACQEGLYTNKNNDVVNFDEAVAYISDLGDCFAKPSIGTDSGNGCGVYCLVGGIDKLSGKTCREVLSGLGENFVLQERIKCHESIRKIYAGSVNTFRIMTYRWHDSIVSAPVIMRIGRGGGTSWTMPTQVECL